MRNLFEAAAVEEVKRRIARLRPDSERLWGEMSPAQALAHLSAQFEMIAGRTFPPRSMPGRLFGRLAKSILMSEKPIRRNMPTDKELIVNDDRDFDTERQKLQGMIDCFAENGPAGCTKHPHSFLGPLTPEEWARLMYKHVDHHLQQFGV
ncbi:DUF1569 domain-containing protein [Granulicella mallensis]|uniref:DUF1569 domain-containing protein n=1 Tax=Granulicella mallensis (strain ATCC BAA-1857 / DSM 23137 / MP5ACTX8) TaxID=682795 RepID=G8NTR1_GRAMM|nr:DUF1569 domain-containing protein [Granulicella mallensis]AEU36385.1 protein of unknown function DUF1569 [Granulicella mallensis MP5ACTX8]